MRHIRPQHNSLLAFVLTVLVCASVDAAETATPALSDACTPKPPSRGPVLARGPVNAASARADSTPSQTVLVYCSGQVPPKPSPSASAPTGDSDASPWLDFWSKVITALSWPLVAAIAAWRLAPHLQGKLKDLTKVKAGPVEAEFSKQVEELRKEVEEKVPEARENRTFSDDEGRLLELARFSPRSAIIEAWRNVEVSAAKAVELRLSRKEFSPSATSVRTQLNTTALGRELGLLEILNGQQVSLFHELRMLRNKAAHSDDFEIDFEAVNNYIQLAQSLRQILQNA